MSLNYPQRRTQPPPPEPMSPVLQRELETMRVTSDLLNKGLAETESVGVALLFSGLKGVSAKEGNGAVIVLRHDKNSYSTGINYRPLRYPTRSESPPIPKGMSLELQRELETMRVTSDLLYQGFSQTDSVGVARLFSTLEGVSARQGNGAVLVLRHDKDASSGN